MHALSIIVLSFQTLSSSTAFNLSEFSSLFSFSSQTEPPDYTQKTVLVLVANGTEELEAVTTISILSYAGILVTVAGLYNTEPVTCARGVTVVPNCKLQDVLYSTFDGIVIPGGKEATDKFCESQDVGNMLRRHEKGNHLIGATTSGALVLHVHQICYGRRITSSPEYGRELSKNYSYKTWDTVVDGSFITSRYPGLSMQFALSVVNHLTSKLVAETVSKELIPFRPLAG